MGHQNTWSVSVKYAVAFSADSPNNESANKTVYYLYICNNVPYVCIYVCM